MSTGTTHVVCMHDARRATTVPLLFRQSPTVEIKHIRYSATNVYSLLTDMPGHADVQNTVIQQINGVQVRAVDEVEPNVQRERGCPSHDSR